MAEDMAEPQSADTRPTCAAWGRPLELTYHVTTGMPIPISAWRQTMATSVFVADFAPRLVYRYHRPVTARFPVFETHQTRADSYRDSSLFRN